MRGVARPSRFEAASTGVRRRSAAPCIRAVAVGEVASPAEGQKCPSLAPFRCIRW